MAAGLAAATLALVVALAPSPRLVAFVHGNDIWVVGTDGRGAHNLTNTPYANESSPSWSPDGTQLVYLRGAAVWEMHADGSDPHLVVSAPLGGWAS